MTDRIKEIIEHQNPDGVKLALGNVYYDCKEEEKRLLYSTVADTPSIDVLILLDGPYKFLTEPNVYKILLDKESTDGTNEMIDTFEEEQRESGSRGIKVYRENFIGNEFEKRQRYLELCQVFKCNVLMIVDSDEYVIEDPRIQATKNWNDFRGRLLGALDHDHNVYDIDIIHTEFGGRSPHKRIWIRPEQMTYWAGSHYRFRRIRDPNAEQSEWMKRHNSQNSWYTFKEITLKHDHNLRTEDHFFHRKVYENYLVQYESLLESGYSIKDADLFSRVLMKKMGYICTCTCHKCVERAKFDPRVLTDQRPKIMRKDYDPFADIKERIRNEPEYAKTLKVKFE